MAEGDSRSWLRKLSRELGHMAPYLSSSIERQSRKIEGQLSYDREAHAFKRVNIYIEKGLAGHRQTLTKIVGVVHNQQNGEIDEYRIHCFAFGSAEDELIRAPGPVLVRNPTMAKGAVDVLSAISGDDAPQGQSTLTQLGRPVSGNDLVVVICRGRDSVSLAEPAAGKIEKRKRTIWIYLAGGGVEIETGLVLRRRLRNPETTADASDAPSREAARSGSTDGEGDCE